MSQKEIILEFREKKQTYKIVVGFLLFAVLVLSIGASVKNLELPYILIGIFIIVIFANIFALTYWTCPNCNKYLGGSLDITECKNCGVSFLVENNSSLKVNTNFTKEISTKKLQQSYTHYLKKSIPDYSKYSIYNLVDVYTRIDRKTNTDEIKVIEEQIRYRLNIDPLVDLSEARIQKQFLEILNNEKPLVGQSKEDYEISRILSRLQLVVLFIAVVLMVIYFSGYKNEIIINLGLGFMLFVFLTEFINSFYSDQINIGASSIEYNKSPILFRIFQFLTISLTIIGFTALLVNL